MQHGMWAMLCRLIPRNLLEQADALVEARDHPNQTDALVEESAAATPARNNAAPVSVMNMYPAPKGCCITSSSAKR